MFETVGEELLSGTVVARLTSSRGATAAPGLLEHTDPAMQLPTKLPFGLQDLAVGGPSRLCCWRRHATCLSMGVVLVCYVIRACRSIAVNVHIQSVVMTVCVVQKDFFPLSHMTILVFLGPKGALWAS